MHWCVPTPPCFQQQQWNAVNTTPALSTALCEYLLVLITRISYPIQWASRDCL